MNRIARLAAGAAILATVAFTAACNPSGYTVEARTAAAAFRHANVPGNPTADKINCTNVGSERLADKSVFTSTCWFTPAQGDRAVRMIRLQSEYAPDHSTVKVSGGLTGKVLVSCSYTRGVNGFDWKFNGGSHTCH